MAKDSEDIQIGISNGGVTITQDNSTDFLLPSAPDAVVRNIQLVVNYLVVVRWEHLETL